MLKHLKGNLCRNFSFWAVKRSKKVKKYKDHRWLHKIISIMTTHFNGRNGTETHCFVMSLLSSTLLHFCISESFMGKVLDLNTNLISLESLPVVRRALFACFSSFFVQLQACNIQRGSYKSLVLGLFLVQVNKA